MEQLRISGPTPCPPEVLKAMSRQMINHRGDDFRQILSEVTGKVKQVFQTTGDVLILTNAGTGGMEAAVVNTLSPGDRVLGVSIGAFGDRFSSIAKTYGADVVPLKFEWGKPADPDAIKKALQADPKIKAVLITHNETSTGVTNDLATICPLIKGFGKLLLVDAVSSMSSINVPVEEWKCDVVVSGSQKGWMVPPGLAFVYMSPTAWQANATAKMPRFYFDLAKAKANLEKRETPWTPAVTIFFAMQVGLDLMLKEGLQGIFARHARVGKACRDGLKSIGMSLFAQESHASNTVTAVVADNGLDEKKLRKIMRDEYKIVLAGGQAALEGKIFRVGHLGLVSEAEIKDVIAALKVAAPKAGFQAK